MPTELAVLKVYPRGIQDLSEPNLGYETQVPPLEFPESKPDDGRQLSTEELAETLDWDHGVPPGTQIDRVEPTGFLEPSPWEQLYVEWVAADLDAELSADWCDSNAENAPEYASLLNRLDKSEPFDSPDDVNMAGLTIQRAETRRGEARAVARQIRRWKRANPGGQLAGVRILAPMELIELWRRELGRYDLPVTSFSAKPVIQNGFGRWVVNLTRLASWEKRALRRSDLRAIFESDYWSSNTFVEHLDRAPDETALRPALRIGIRTLRRDMLTLADWRRHMEAKRLQADEQDNQPLAAGFEVAIELSEKLVEYLNPSEGPQNQLAKLQTLIDKEDETVSLGIDKSLRRHEDESNALTDARDLLKHSLKDWIRQLKSSPKEGSERLQRFNGSDDYGLATFLRDSLSEQRQSDNQLREDGIQLYDYETAKRFLCKASEAEGPLFLTGLGEGFIPTVPDKPTQRELAWLEAYGIIDDAEARDAAGNYALEEIERQIKRIERYIARQQGPLVLSWFTEGEGTERVYPGPFLSQLIGGWSDVDWQDVESNPRVNDIRWADELPDSLADADAWFEASLFGEQLAGQQWSPSSPEASERYEQLCQLTENLKASHAAESARSGRDGYYKPSEFTGFIGGKSGRDGPFSPTAMEDYGQCGTKYFLGRVIDLDETSDEDAEPDPLEIGNRIHLAMEAFGEDLLEADELQPLTSTVPSGKERETPLVDEVRAKLEEQFDSFGASEWTGSDGLMDAVSDQWIDASCKWFEERTSAFVSTDRNNEKLVSQLCATGLSETRSDNLENKRRHLRNTVELFEELGKKAAEGVSDPEDARDDAPSLRQSKLSSGDVEDIMLDLRSSDSPRVEADRMAEPYRKAFQETEKEIEAQLNNAFNRHIYKTEFSYRQRDAGPAVIEIDEESIKLSGILDRIDYDLERDTYAVLDYKTGSKAGAKSSRGQYELAMRQGQAFQLMSYALAIEALKGDPGLETIGEAELVQVGFEFLKESDDLTLPREEDEAPTLDELQDVTKKWLRANAENIREGKFPLLPKACPIVDYKGSYCDFEHTCRYNPAVNQTDPNAEPPFAVPESGEAESVTVEDEGKPPKTPEILEVDADIGKLANTHEQAEKSIRENLNEDIVISAGAGTGKTHNLVVRYLQALANERSPSDILCITFTRKAAGEMTYRIRQALLSSDHSDKRMKNLTKEIRQNYGKNLSQLLAELSAAPIGTIDSLAGRIFTEYRELNGRLTDFDTVDDDDLQGELEEFFHRKFVDALDGIGEHHAVQAVQALADEYPVGHLERYLTEVMVSDSLEARPDLSDPDSYIQEIYKNFYAEAIDECFQQLIDFEWEQCRQYFLSERQLESSKPTAEASSRLEAWFKRLDNLQTGEEPSTAEKFRSLADLFQLPGTKDELGGDELYSWLKNKHKDVDWSVVPEFLRKYAKGIREDSANQLTEYFEHVYTIENAWREQLQEYLKRQHRFRHRDVTRIVRQRVFQDDETRSALAERFDFEHILVDEAQDTNQKQVYFIKRLRQLAEESVDTCPIFWVGDYKQSIYRFRGAQVDVFEKLQRETETTLTLTKNRRSTPQLLDAFNRFFGNLFPDRNTGPERSIAGMDYGPIISPDDPEPTEDDSIEIIAQTESQATDDDTFGSVADHSLARRLKQLTEKRKGSDYELNPEQGAEIAVLVTKWDDASNYRELFAQYGLGAAVQGGRGLLNCRETSAFIQWLNALLYPDREIPIVSILRAPPYSLSDTGLFCIAYGYGLSGETSTDLRQKLTKSEIEFSASDALSDWMSSVEASDVLRRDRDELQSILERDAENLSRFKETWSALKPELYRQSTAEFFENLVERENLKGFWNSRPNGQQRVANIEQFLDVVRDFEARRGTEPFELLNELETKRDGSDPAAGGLAASRGADIVITTYWQAKGREWPVVVLPRLHNTSYDSDYAGFGMTRIKPPTSEEPVFLPELKIPNEPFDTTDNKVFKGLTKGLKKQSARAEYKRLFYVAATRAEKRLIMSGTFNPHPTDKTAEQKTWAQMLQYNTNLRIDDDDIRFESASCWENLDSIRLTRATELPPPSPESSEKPTGVPDLPYERWDIYSAREVGITGASLLDAVASVPDWAEHLSTTLPESREEADEHATSSKPGQAFHYLMEQWGYRTDTVEDDLLEEALDAHQLLDRNEDDRLDRLRKLWENIRDADIVPDLKRAAANNDLWHEVPVRFPTDDSEIIVGEVDLLWRDSEGLHLLDYKSGTSYPTQEDDGKLSEHYPQVRIYADGIERLAGEPVVDYGLWYVRKDVRLRWGSE